MLDGIDLKKSYDKFMLAYAPFAKVLKEEAILG